MLVPKFGNEPKLHFFGNRLHLQEEPQIIRPSGFGVGARHFETAERLHPHHGPGNLAVEIKIPHVKFPLGPLQAVPAPAEKPAREAVFGVVKDAHRVIEVAALITANTGPKISRWASRASGGTSLKTVGSK